MILVGDIGGTNATLALISEKDGSFVLRQKQRFSTNQLTGVEEAIRRFQEDAGADWHDISRCCLSAAGPVRNGRCVMTNLPFVIDEAEISKEIDTNTVLINDFSAICYALPLLDTHDAIESIVLPHMDGSTPAAHGPVRAVVGAGTGLGTGYLVQSGNTYTAFPSEGGHSDFPTPDELSRAFFKHLSADRSAPQGVEPHLSGQGIRNALRFLTETDRIETDQTVRAILAAEEARIPELVAREAEDHAGLARVMELFVVLYARYARNTALFFLPHGGLYLAGGIAAKNRSWFTEENRFMRVFEQNYNEKITPLLREMPVSLILDYDVSLYGAAHAALCL